MLVTANYLDFARNVEVAGQIYGSENGIRYVPQPVQTNATRTSTDIEIPTPRAGEQSVMIHTHPAGSNGPSPADRQTATNFRNNNDGSGLGLIVTNAGVIVGHGGRR
jgi:proteasome lid subunit RPN8/RPN11